MGGAVKLVDRMEFSLNNLQSERLDNNYGAYIMSDSLKNFEHGMILLNLLDGRPTIPHFDGETCWEEIITFISKKEKLSLLSS